MARKRSFRRRARSAGNKILPPVLVGAGAFGGVVISDAIEGSSWTADQKKFGRAGIGAGLLLLPAFVSIGGNMVKHAMWGAGAYVFGRFLADQFTFAGVRASPSVRGLEVI